MELELVWWSFCLNLSDRDLSLCGSALNLSDGDLTLSCQGELELVGWSLNSKLPPTSSSSLRQDKVKSLSGKFKAQPHKLKSLSNKFKQKLHQANKFKLHPTNLRKAARVEGRLQGCGSRRWLKQEKSAPTKVSSSLPQEETQGAQLLPRIGLR